MPFRIGVIGAGAVAETHLRAMQMLPDVQAVAVADVDLGRARALAGRHGITAIYESAPALLRGSQVDALDILTPHHLHLPAVEAAAEAGKHVLVEKAIAETPAAADKMIEVCRARGVTLGGIFQNRFTDAGRRLRGAVQSGQLGRVFLATVTVKTGRTAAYFLGAPWRGQMAEAGGGVLMIQAIHTLDLLQWVLGIPRRVFGRTATAVHPIAVEDLAVGLLEFKDGAMAVLQATTAAVPEIPPELEVHGDRGTAVVFDSRGYLGFWQSSLDRPVPLPERWSAYTSHYHEQEATIPTQASPEPHAENIRDFVAAVREGRPPLVDGVEARKAVVLIDALYRSAHAGRWVEIA